MAMTSLLSRRDLLKAGAAGALSTVLLGSVKAAEPARGIVGQAAPELNIPYWVDGNGNKAAAFSVAANRGKWVFLKCFQHWCPGCHSSGFPSLQQLVAKFGEHPQVAIAAIQTTFEGFSTNNRAALVKNQQRYNLAIPFGHDTGDESAPHGDSRRYPNTMLSYRTGGTPWMVLINPEGRVVFNDFHINMQKLIALLEQQLIV